MYMKNEQKAAFTTLKAYKTGTTY